MAFSAGTQLDGYEILGLLGAGGMGEVYRALDPVLKREVAIKVLPSSVAQDAGRLRRFELEAQATAAIDHPNILPIYRFGVFEGAPYLVSASLEGGTLRQLLEHGPLPVRKAIDISVQVAHGLAAAHDKGIVHRDLKPENLFVTKSGLTKILDFGLAKLMQAPTGSDVNAPTLTRGTDPGQVMGTAGYMAPEQVRAQAVDHRTDIFAFGAILYEMLSGRRAFHRSTAADTMTAILREDPPIVSQRAQSAPSGLQRVLQRCLEKAPEQRFQSASDLAFALQALSDSGALSPQFLVAAKGRTPRKAILWSTATIVVLAVALTGYFVIADSNKAASLHISEYTQITHDGNAGSLRGTDGSRLYINATEGDWEIREVAVSGGDSAAVRVSLPDPVLLDVSPDGSKFLVASFKGATRFSHPIWSVRILGGSLQYLAVGYDASWSPDGNFVAYSTAEGDIFVIRSDGTGAHKLISVGGRVNHLRWSPDNTAMRFEKEKQLWEMTAGGANLHSLLPGWKGSLCCGHWSTDGNLFFFNSDGQIWARDEHRGLFRHSPLRPVRLTSGPIGWGSPIPGKDGGKIFATGSTPHGELVRLDSQTRQFQPYLHGLSADNLSFSRDGKSLVFTTYPDSILWKANTDGSNRVQLSTPPTLPIAPRWSPDGSQILFTELASDHGEKAFVVSTQGGSPQRLLPEDAGMETDPNWSPDGRKVVFSTSREGGGDPKSLINVVDLDSKRVSTLPGSVGLFSPRWSPDGRSIAAVRMNSTTLNIFDMAAQKWSTPYKGVVAYPAWSNDGRSIYFMDFQQNPAVFRMRVVDGTIERLVDIKTLNYTGNSGMWMGVDPTGAPLFLRDLGTRDVYALSLNGR
jgi:serine/threonine protein kinase/Tol biopolymer transport system component